MKKIIFVGGGTLGPVTPLLAVAHVLKKRQPTWSFTWIGTPQGPERRLVEEAQIPFYAVTVAKLPRYPSVEWLSFPWRAWQASLEAKKLIRDLAPSAIVTAGGFTALPVVRAASKKHIPCFTHQLDVVPGLTNRRIAALCTSVTSSFVYHDSPFGPRVSVARIATPTGYSFKALPNRESAVRSFGLNPEKPVVLVFGGGTGAQALNDMIMRTKGSWLQATQVIHVTGLGKEKALTNDPEHGYALRTFLGKEMLSAYAAADLVVCRAGMGGLSEISALKKAVVLVPIPNSHQEVNARVFEEHQAARIIHQSSANFDKELLTCVQELLNDPEARQALGQAVHDFLPTDDGTEFAERIMRSLS